MSKVELRDDTKDANFNENWLFPISGIALRLYSLYTTPN